MVPALNNSVSTPRLPNLLIHTVLRITSCRTHADNSAALFVSCRTAAEHIRLERIQPSHQRTCSIPDSFLCHGALMQRRFQLADKLLHARTKPLVLAVQRLILLMESLFSVSSNSTRVPMSSTSAERASTAARILKIGFASSLISTAPQAETGRRCRP